MECEDRFCCTLGEILMPIDGVPLPFTTIVPQTGTLRNPYVVNGNGEPVPFSVTVMGQVTSPWWRFWNRKPSRKVIRSVDVPASGSCEIELKAGWQVFIRT